MNRKEIIILAVGVLAILAVSMQLNERAKKKSDWYKAIAQAAESLHRTCPVLLDAETRQDAVEAKTDRRVVFHRTLIHADVRDIDVASFKDRLRPGLVNHVRTHPEMQVFRDHRVAVVYVYQDKAAQEAFRVVVIPKDDR